MGGKVQLGLLDVDRDDGCEAAGAGEGACEEAYGAGAEDQHARAGLQVCAAEGVEDDGEGLGEGRDVEGDRVGEPGVSARSRAGNAGQSGGRSARVLDCSGKTGAAEGLGGRQ